MSKMRVCPLCKGKEGTEKMKGKSWFLIAANNGSNDQKRFVCSDCSVWTDHARPKLNKGDGVKNQLDIVFKLSRQKAYGFLMGKQAIAGFLRATFDGCTTYPLDSDEIRVITAWTAKVNNIRAMLANIANIGDIVSVRSLERAEKNRQAYRQGACASGRECRPEAKKPAMVEYHCIRQWFGTR